LNTETVLHKKLLNQILANSAGKIPALYNVSGMFYTILVSTEHWNCAGKFPAQCARKFPAQILHATGVGMII